MKKLLCAIMVFGFICFCAFASYAADYSCEEAAKHIGETATVCGKIVDTMPYEGQTLLGMGKAVMEPGAVGIEVADALKEKLDKDLYVGKEICVTGEIHKNPSEGASITVTDAAQIKVK
ncbi:MAG: hypothetical protein JW927_04440 [Deltaproteobacteria bacterium]|nr:hypothetical protein [Deltaproteobacteria bacterium]